jgi:hypothetical protein
LPIPITSRVFPALSYTKFRVSGLIFRSLIHFELILVQGDRHGSSFSFLQADNHFSQQHLLKSLSFLHQLCFLNPKAIYICCFRVRKQEHKNNIKSIQNSLFVGRISMTMLVQIFRARAQPDDHVVNWIMFMKNILQNKVTFTSARG